MFENIEIRKAANGIIVTVTTDEDTKEYIFQTARKAIFFIRGYIDGKPATDE